MYHVRLDDGLYQSVVYDLCFLNCVEVFGGYHEVCDVFTEVTDLISYMTQKLIAEPSPNDHYCLWMYPCQEELHENTDQRERVTAS